ncbi:pilus assembly protein PilO [Neobacillus niacini]|uniref:pilus assembly protein PilO n=1 Tax=Neobacillus niacini TaxID=86668 RepID=UPI00285C442F|nr:pilus assembly protein PilO [Neobacillus niacini]MDR7001482.1 type IV pilus assembly protein PilO [Neobacillus niacini]
MNLEFTKKHVFVLVLSFFMLVLLSLGAYYLYVLPVNTDLIQKKSELKMSNQQITIVQNKLAQTSNQTVFSTMELQRKVPVKRLLDQVLLDIQKAEIVSGTNIVETKLDGTEKDEELINETTGKLNQNQNQNQTTNNSNQQQTASQQNDSLPNGIKKTSIVLSGEANNYFEMEKFLKELETLDRIIKIDQFKFTGKEEIYSVDQSDKPIEFEVTFSVYYYPSLVDLQKEIPPLDTPKISNKNNPISEFSDSTGNGGDNDESNR